MTKIYLLAETSSEGLGQIMASVILATEQDREPFKAQSHFKPPTLPDLEV